MPKLISLIIPIYNEEKNLRPLYDELIAQVGNLHRYNLEILFINDGSRDHSGVEIERLRKQDPRVQHLEFSRNFGKEIATTAGIHAAKGDAAIMLDGDLQHPPRLIPEFLKRWEEGVDMVIGVRQHNQNEGLIKRYGSKAFYKTLALISDNDITPHSTDYRLIDRSVIEAFNSFTERSRMTRGILDWLGFTKDYVYFDADPRRKGQASYTIRKLFNLAIAGFISQSLFPLRIAGYLGIIIVSISGPLGLVILFDKYIFNDPLGISFSGLAIVAVTSLFLSGVTLCCLGLIALYIANIHQEVMNRPLYVLRPSRPLPATRRKKVSNGN